MDSISQIFSLFKELVARCVVFPDFFFIIRTTLSGVSVSKYSFKLEIECFLSCPIHLESNPIQRKNNDAIL